jgi:pimeloyl-ACP methyl ester carboxylesterase
MVDVQSEPVIRRVKTNGIELSVAEYGKSGPPLVLLHGIGSRYVSWWPVIGPLADHFRLIIPDLRGHGDSDKPETGYLFVDYADDLDGLLAAFGIDRPCILGHSLGALTALTWASIHLAKAAKIVLEDPPATNGHGDTEMLEGWRVLSSGTIDEAVAVYRQRFPEWTEEERYRRAISITSTAPGVFQDLIDAIRSGGYADWIELSKDIETPVLIVYGEIEHGSSTLPEVVAQFEQTLADAQSVVIPGGGHSLHRDNTDAFLAATVPFLLEGLTGVDRSGHGSNL